MDILLSQLSEPGNGRQDPPCGALVGSDVVILVQNCIVNFVSFSDGYSVWLCLLFHVLWH